MAERKSIYHGLTTDGHGPDERGHGALASPEDPRDFPLAQLLAATGPVAAYPSSWVEPNTPPVTNQGTTPQCVAYSSAYDQNQRFDLRPRAGLLALLAGHKKGLGTRLGR